MDLSGHHQANIRAVATLVPVFLSLLPALAQPSLSLSAQTSGAGTSFPISLTLASGAQPVSAVQFDIEYDNTTLSLNAVPGASLRTSGKNIYFQNVAPNQARFLIAGMNQSPINDGDILDLFVGVNATAAQGSYGVVLANVVASDGSGSVIAVSSSNGMVSVEGTSGSMILPSEVLSSASLTAGPVAPGELITLIGSGIGPAVPQAAGTAVLFDATPAPLLYAGQNQINAIVPYEIAGQTTTQVSILSNGELLAGFSIPVAAAAPAIFTMNASGIGPGSILNQDSTVNSPSNPAARGSIIVIYATGAGNANPQPLDGQIMGSTPATPLLPVSVTIGGVNSQIIYAASAPSEIAGVLQINCVVPQAVAPGSSVAVNLTVGTISGPTGVTLAVQ